MNALDFMFVCVGLGTLSVCVGWAVKIILDVRARNEALRITAKLKDEQPTQIDPMNQRFIELRNARFGIPLRQAPLWTTKTVTSRPVRQRDVSHLRSVANPKDEGEK